MVGSRAGIGAFSCPGCGHSHRAAIAMVLYAETRVPELFWVLVTVEIWLRAAGTTEGAMF